MCMSCGSLLFASQAGQRCVAVTDTDRAEFHRVDDTADLAYFGTVAGVDPRLVGEVGEALVGASVERGDA